MRELDWYGLYAGGWRKEISDESFSHPAKFARGLIGRIYRHALKQGYIKPGDTILDPFGGVGLGAVDALRHGVHWRGVDLEQPFVDLGAGCDCTGISPSDWARFYGRWKQARYLDGRHWCPWCISEAGVVLDEPPTPQAGQAQAVRRARIAELSEKHNRRVPKYDPLPLPDGGYVRRPTQLTIFDKVDSPSYERNSGRIPRTGPHHFTGNLELFARRYARDGATAALVQGDSRELGKVLGEADGVISSPPFQSSQKAQDIGFFCEVQRKWRPKSGGSHPSSRGVYAPSADNLGDLPATSAQFNAAIGSPPYAGQTIHGGGGIDTEKVKRAGGRNSQASAMDDYGDTRGQLGEMPEGPHAAVIGSPPYAESLSSDDPDKRGGLFRDPKRRNDKTLTAEYGQSKGQLEVMKVISSLPYAESLDRGTVDKTARVKLAARRGISSAAVSPIDMEQVGKRDQEYGDTPGQLGVMRVVPSPPWEASVSTMEAENAKRYGGWAKNTDGSNRLARSLTGGGYGSAPDQLGKENGTDFWTAARQIMEQVAQALAPGAVAIWVLGGFVRDWKYVDFPDQWRRLGEACGFKSLEWIRAWKVESLGAQYTLEGKLEKLIIRRKTFFRITNERKGSPPVDFEVVLVQRRL
ncbi:MAG: hypothetical protein V3W44_02290 [Dehalococcoidales bacterium]